MNSDWKECKLGDLAEITSSKRIFYSEYVANGVPFFRSKEIIERFNRQNTSIELFITRERYEEIKLKFGAPQVGDMLLTSVGTLGIPYLVQKDDEFYFKDGNLTWFRNINSKFVDKRFLYLWITSIVGQQKLYEALYRKGHLYYMGLASNLRNRLKSHLTDRHAQTWDSFSVYLTINDSHLHELETLILKIASPKGNRQSGNFIKAQNLKPIFKNAVTKAQQKELIGLGLIKTNEVAKPKVTAQKGSKAILAPYVKNSFEIRFRYKGKLHKAIVRKDGSILHKGEAYNSPSMAAAAITKRAMNGWASWTYQRAPGDWVLLDVLRKK